MTRVEALRRTLTAFYGLLDNVEARWLKEQAAGPVTLRDRIAVAAIRQRLNASIDSTHRELSRLARRGVPVDTP